MENSRNAVEVEEVSNQGFKPRNLENIIVQKGYQNGRLFFNDDSATYTTLHEDVVTSLHFDREKRSIFLNGRQVRTPFAHKDLDELLTRFHREMQRANLSQDFLNAFGTAVSLIKQQ